MVVVDSSVWIEWLTGTALGEALRADLPERAECLVPTLVQLEVAKWLLRERTENEADLFVAYTQKCAVVPLDTRLALAAAELCGRHRLATADAIVYATALQERAELLTCDVHFASLPQVRYRPK